MSTDDGQRPGSIDLAQDDICMTIDALMLVAITRALAPGSFPCSGPDPTLDILAGRIVANLLNDGWTPPPGKPLTGARWDDAGLLTTSGRDRPLKFFVFDVFHKAQDLAREAGL